MLKSRLFGKYFYGGSGLWFKKISMSMVNYLASNFSCRPTCPPPPPLSLSLSLSLSVYYLLEPLPDVSEDLLGLLVSRVAVSLNLRQAVLVALQLPLQADDILGRLLVLLLEKRLNPRGGRLLRRHLQVLVHDGWS